MNRTVVIGGVVAVVVLLGVAAWLLVGGRSFSLSGQHLAGENTGPTILNPVEVITDHTATQAPDGRTLSIAFPKFELAAKSGETASAVFSTNWRVKLGPDERGLVAIASFDGFMKSAATPMPAPAPEAAATPATPATTPAATTPAAEGTTTPATTEAAKPAEPATPPAPAKPVASDGVARVIVTFGNDTTVTEWTDTTGAGAEHKFSKAAAFVGGASDLRDGGTVPVTITVELSGGTAGDAQAKLNGLELKLFAESAPLPKPEPAAGTEPPPAATTDAAKPVTTDTATAPAATPTTTTPPADGAATTPATPPASGTPTP